MGKSSKRREGREQVKQPRNRTPVGSKPAFTRTAWKTDAEAFEGLADLGWHQAKCCPSYTSVDVCREIELLVEGKGIEVVDSTHIVPEGASACHREYPSALSKLEEISEESPTKLFIILRTRQNTPGFLGGTSCMFIADMGGRDVAVEYTKQMTTPVIVALYAGIHISLPTLAVQGTAKLPATIIVAMINDQPEAFRCAICKESFLIKHENNQYELKSFLAPMCNHAYHPKCIKQYLQSGARKCHTCGHPFAEDWLKEGRPSCVNSFMMPTLAELSWRSKNLQISDD
jgi:hypothetical protein